ncbi:FHA domain-containing protein [Sphaerospermopsis aphanizomenoides BCCUSP55]|uniref:FHA domain-containing protein n=1 Tax=Sphaerospermopsis aphanizomenoides TaxID=459663 RepID=UPI0019040BA4|nr:FHA domain-containing protein [Sphaerospermopsis aphanizomenoides]MBK1990141.1 FHA domain-containing protein [Sphaerospermopsis aphanizomenoides BCCUSP55]
MQLKIVQQTGGTDKNWTLTPNRECIIGSGSGCDITLPYPDIVSDRHLRLYFDKYTQTWQAQDLVSSNGTFIDSQRITDYQITRETRIAVGGGIFITVTPVGNVASNAPAPPAPPPPPQPVYTPPTPKLQKPVSNGGHYQYRDGQSVSRNTNRNQSYSRKVLSWREYVEKQAAKLEGIGHLATWFHMTTGFRNTPWIRGFGSNDKSNNFNSFDGYILPDFQESEQAITDAIEERLSKMQQYQDTDCFIARLTDAHIADSATQSFLGVELFPIRRSKLNEADYRRFCVVSYHRVRTYLLVENYGSDLFVSWVTRFEPDPTSVIILLWLILAIFITLFALPTGNFFMIITPLTIWGEIYWLTPLIMQSMNIVPKKANARLVTGLLVVPTLFLISIAAGITAFQRSFPY